MRQRRESHYDAIQRAAKKPCAGSPNRPGCKAQIPKSGNRKRCDDCRVDQELTRQTLAQKAKTERGQAERAQNKARAEAAMYTNVHQ